MCSSKILNRVLYCLFSIVFMLLLTGCICSSCDLVMHPCEKDSFGANEKELLLEDMQKIESWSDPQKYGPREWSHVFMLVNKLNTMCPTDVSILLWEHKQRIARLVKAGQEVEWDSDSQLYILLRIMFEVPEIYNENETKCYKGYIRNEYSGNKVIKYGPRDAAWPVRWNKGNPYLESHNPGCIGIGCDYRPEEEYKYFLVHYKMRKNIAFNTFNK